MPYEDVRADILKYFNRDADDLTGADYCWLASRLPEYFVYIEGKIDGEQAMIPQSSIARYFRDNPAIVGTTEEELISDEELAAMMA